MSWRMFIHIVTASVAVCEFKSCSCSCCELLEVCIFVTIFGSSNTQRFYVVMLSKCISTQMAHLVLVKITPE